MPERYNSGTSLSRTHKEEVIDALEAMIEQGCDEFSDELYTGLKKLNSDQLRELHRRMAGRINSVHQQYKE